MLSVHVDASMEGTGKSCFIKGPFEEGFPESVIKLDILAVLYCKDSATKQIGNAPMTEERILSVQKAEKSPVCEMRERKKGTT